ncbi:hypothetical protein L291_1742 [Acinetobacter guillouiae MSP4-18]|uniref:hypothetical protein n=2 Tax=Acinetobacter TaxID=469 RepID=UPI0002CFB3B9|nr:hypothetical protein [Acinetobacter guillouiae]ENU57145.1 hypothetical protein F981_03819 [Acinetobacter guillouiae CIP 63.46]EPH36198.1 hypothetical protein L291_1742 [Acinetobacter guillouiae MSP4-18]KAB0624229.1 hypothetical protein F7P82_18125 [Acinetobacter guillouiae]
MKMNISSKETHQRVHFYRFSQKELERLALERIATELGLDLQSKAIQPEARVLTQNNGINPTMYECEIRIVEVLDCKD